MTLRNAFDGLATDSMLRRILHAVAYARDINDRMRVVVDGTVVTANYTYWGSGGNYPLPNGTGSPNAVDAREPMRQQYRANAIAVRQGRWTF